MFPTNPFILFSDVSSVTVISRGVFIITLILVIQTCLSPLNRRKNGKLSFLDIEVPRKKGKFRTTVYRKPTFSGVYTHFESFLPTIQI